MHFLEMMRLLVSLQNDFPGSSFGLNTDHDGSTSIVAILPVSEENAELYRQGLVMFSD